MAVTTINTKKQTIPQAASSAMSAALAPRQTQERLTDQTTSDFNSRLTKLVDAAQAYSVEFVEPAEAAHNAIDHARVAVTAEQRAALDTVIDAAWRTWEDHCKAYRHLVEPILDLVPATPHELLQQVDAYIDLMNVHWSKLPKAETPMGRLCPEEIAEIAEHMHRALKSMTGPGGVSPVQPNRPVPSLSDQIASVVRVANSLALDIKPAHDAFNEADAAWVDTKGEGEEALRIRRDALEDIWWKSLDRFSAYAEFLFDLPASTPAQRREIVRAYADLLAPVFGDQSSDNPLECLPKENLLVVMSYLDGTRQKTLLGPDEIEEAWIKAKAEHEAAQARQAWSEALERRAALQRQSDAKAGDLSDEESLELGKASCAVYATPAPDIDAVIAKIEDNMIEKLGVSSIDEALAELDAGDLGDKCDANVYRDLRRLVGRPHAEPQALLLAAE